LISWGGSHFQIVKDHGNGRPRVAEYPRATPLAGDALHGGTLRPIESWRLPLLSFYGSRSCDFFPRTRRVLPSLRNWRFSPPVAHHFAVGNWAFAPGASYLAEGARAKPNLRARLKPCPERDQRQEFSFVSRPRGGVRNITVFRPDPLRACRVRTPGAWLTP